MGGKVEKGYTATREVHLNVQKKSGNEMEEEEGKVGEKKGKNKNVRAGVSCRGMAPLYRKSGKVKS